MRVGKRIRVFVSAALFLAGTVMFTLSLRESRAGMNADTAARRLSRVLERRMSQLDTYVSKALDTAPDEWMNLGALPQDMVVYRYCRDTLQSWCNQFPVSKDDIRNRFIVPFISNPRRMPVSPLLQVEDSVSYVNLGPRWYLAKSASKGDVKVIAGLEIQDMQNPASRNGVNASLHLQPEFSVLPLSSGGGAVVTLGGRPQFELLRETLRSPASADTLMLWLARHSLPLCREVDAPVLPGVLVPFRGHARLLLLGLVDTRAFHHVLARALCRRRRALFARGGDHNKSLDTCLRAVYLYVPRGLVFLGQGQSCGDSLPGCVACRRGRHPFLYSGDPAQHDPQLRHITGAV